MRWEATPITIRQARLYLLQWHRRLPLCHAARFAVAVSGDGRVRGVAFCGKPTATREDQSRLEVLRLATDGSSNACTRLQRVVDCVARAMGYKVLITYTNPEENGASLKAAGWKGPTPTRGGTRASRPGRQSVRQPRRWKWTRTVN